MTARSIGDVLAGRETKMRRTFAPVRRNSRHRGEREDRIWRSFGRTNQDQRRFIGAWLQAAERFEEVGKQPGKRNGPLGHIAIRVLRELFRHANWKTGQLEPAIATICGKIRRSRAAVVAAMARLKEHGFLDWIRRTEPTDNVGAGPQVRQITNAYGFDLKQLAAKAKHAAAYVKKAIGFGIPVPDDELARQDQDKANVETMLGTMTMEDQARAVGPADMDPALEESLAALGRALDRSASSPSGQNPGHGE